LTLIQQLGTGKLSNNTLAIRMKMYATQATKTQGDTNIAIAVMGATGSGKTTFINTLSGSNLRIGRGLQSCTSVVQAAAPFQLDGHTILLIDTPGFDDTTKSDTDILKEIAAFLASTYQKGMRLSGVIYMHRISDVRMGGISRRNFSMFRQLCGDESLMNVLIVTNMWGEVDHKVGEDREAELRNQDIFFKPALDKGARLLRHQNTLSSAQAIVYCILENRPMALQIQQELVDRRMDISQTAAGTVLNRELMEQARKHKEELREIQAEMQAAIRAKDEETRQELEEAAQKLKAEMLRVQTESQGLRSSFNNEKARMERQMKEMAEAAARAAEEYQRQMQALDNQLRDAVQASSAERDAILKRMDDLQRRYEADANRGGGCIIL